MSDSSQPNPKRLKTETTLSPSPSTMAHSSFLAQSHFSNPYNPSYPAHSTFPSHSQQGYMSYPYSQPGQQLSPHYPQQQQQQHLPHTMQPYQPPPMSPTSSRKRMTEMDTPMEPSVALTPMSSYSLSSQSMMPPGPAQHGPASGLGISTIPSQGLEGEATRPPAEAAAGPAKKGRTNTPWSPAEELKLKQMRDAFKSWSEIAKAFPNRTEGSVKKHWYKDMHYADFTPDEGSFKATLVAAHKEYEQNKWKIIGQKVGKPAKACEAFWKDHISKN